MYVLSSIQRLHCFLLFTNSCCALYRKDLVGRYASLYYQNRPRALEALDSLPELVHATQLKSKILFSVVVVSHKFITRLHKVPVN